MACTDVGPLYRIYGPCTNPQITFPGGAGVLSTTLTIASGHYVQIDPNARTAFMDGDPTQSQFSFLSVGTGVWQPLPPGSSFIGFRCTSPGAGTQLQVDNYDAWLI